MHTNNQPEPLLKPEGLKPAMEDSESKSLVPPTPEGEQKRIEERLNSRRKVTLPFFCSVIFLVARAFFKCSCDCVIFVVRQ